MKKEINLEAIINKYPYLGAFLSSAQGYETCKKLMKEAIELSLDLAAENVNDINIDNIVFAETPEIALEGKNKLRTLILEIKDWIK